jgi:hypothetical protein
MAQGTNVLELSRTSGVMLVSQSKNSKGSGALIGDQHVLTCFHVVATLSVQGSTVNCVRAGERRSQFCRYKPEPVNQP